MGVPWHFQGVRLVGLYSIYIYTQGCGHGCVGCHNKHTHDPKAGVRYTIQGIVERLEGNKGVTGITLSGG
jgi:anaerobic ribonucleoside-triphosphate reductase activating protein